MQVAGQCGLAKTPASLRVCGSVSYSDQSLIANKKTAENKLDCWSCFVCRLAFFPDPVVVNKNKHLSHLAFVLNNNNGKDGLDGEEEEVLLGMAQNKLFFAQLEPTTESWLELSKLEPKVFDIINAASV